MPGCTVVGPCTHCVLSASQQLWEAGTVCAPFPGCGMQMFSETCNRRQTQTRSWCEGCLLRVARDVLSPDLSLAPVFPRRRLDLTFEDAEAEGASKVAYSVPLACLWPPSWEA